MGKSPCDIYEQKLLGIAKDLMLTTDMSISAIARHLTFDPSNFTKFFRHFEGITPKQYRERSAVKN
jgi:AraC-like DNA-binding protein